MEGQAAEPVSVNDAVPSPRDRQQARVVAGRQRPDEPDPGRFDPGVIGSRVLPGVVDQGERVEVAGQVPVPGNQLLHDSGELGDVWAVAGIGVGNQRDPAVASDDQTQTNQPQIGAFLFGLTPLRDWGLTLWESMNVAKFVMSSTRPDRSRPNSVTIRRPVRVSIV